MRRTLTLAVAVAAVAALAPAPPAAAAARTDVHCTLTVIGQRDTGELVTGELSCSDEGPATMSVTATIATHYTGANYTGSTLTVTGAGCSGWLNMPTGWANVVSSTASGCTVRHYDGYGLTGSSQTTWSPGGNLTTLDNRTNSTSYS